MIIKAFISSFFCLTFLFTQSELIDRYHTYADVADSLFSWNEKFSNNQEPSAYYPTSGIIYQLQEIGRSTTEDIPIYAVKLSYNADQELDKPKVLILGQCHAEEILGVEISMEIIKRFLYPDQYLSDIQTLISSLYFSEIWIVPSHNPEGLGVVHGWEEEGQWLQDVTFRKNKTDVNGNNVFDFDPEGYGNDIDGVDLNRNYDFNWIFGDPEGALDGGCSGNPSYISHYDYYRGAEPFSEKEVQAVRDFAMDKKFLLSIAYHSSRSGCVSERVIYPWLWGGGKASPDYSIISTLGQEIAEIIPVEIGDGTYHHAGSSSPKGNAHDWMYAKTGCIQYLLEVGTENMQPDDIDLIEDTIDRNVEGAYHLFRRASGISEDGHPDKFQITGIVTDALSGAVLSDVEVKILEMHSSILSPRLTDGFGRYRRLLEAGTFTLEFSAFGYETQIIENIIPSSGSITELDVQLVPLNEFDFNLSLSLPDYHDSSINMIRFIDNKVDTFIIDNYQSTYFWPEGNYDLLFISNDIFPKSVNVDILSETNVELDLYWYDVLFSDSFNSLDNWSSIYGDWNVSDGRLLSQSGLTYSGFHPLGPHRINLTNSFYVPDNDSQDIAIKLLMKHEVEWDKDTLFVDLYNSNDSINVLSLMNQNWSFHDEYINTTVTGDSDYYISMGISPDVTLGWRGLDLDKIDVLRELVNGCKNGDYNHDGNIDISDIVGIINYIIGLNVINGYQECAAEMNDDGYIDVLDILVILNIILE